MDFELSYDIIIEKDYLFWCYQQSKLLQTKIIVAQTKRKEIIYITSEGNIIRIDQVDGTFNNTKIMNNLSQIKNLNWIGEYRNLKKVGKWTAAWNKQILRKVGGQYNEDGKKEGYWYCIIRNYWEKAQVLQIGEYINEKRIGFWKYYDQHQNIGGGFYDDQGLKIGLWFALSSSYFEQLYIMDLTLISQSKVTYLGEYNKDKKQGRWKIYFSNNIIGGGQYDIMGLKYGNWVDLVENFYIERQITFNGLYFKGKKQGKWDIYFRERSDTPFQLIGCGIYDQNGLKNGNWIDISDDFCIKNQVTYNGRYNNDQKIGQWNVYQMKYDKASSKELNGGGFYSECGFKEGLWIEMTNNCSYNCQTIEKGEYKYGKKQGSWSINNKMGYGNYRFDKIGGGQYQQQGLKNGKWIDLIENFYEQKQAVLQGEYKNGKKWGLWEVYLKYPYSTFKLIGCGLYDNDGLKNGKWVDLSLKFDSIIQFINYGDYKNGRKQGLWFEMRRNNMKEGFIKTYINQNMKVGNLCMIDNMIRKLQFIFNFN